MSEHRRVLDRNEPALRPSGPTPVREAVAGATRVREGAALTRGVGVGPLRAYVSRAGRFSGTIETERSWEESSCALPVGARPLWARSLLRSCCQHRRTRKPPSNR